MSGCVHGRIESMVACPQSLRIHISLLIPGHTGDLSRVLGRHLLAPTDAGLNHWTRMGSSSVTGRACDHVICWFGKS